MTKQIIDGLKITDVDPQIVEGVLKIEVNGKWRKYPAVEFFEFLCPEHLSGHDPKEQIAWVESPIQVRFNPDIDGPEEYKSPWSYSSKGYEEWIRDEFMTDDDLLLKYVRTAQFFR